MNKNQSKALTVLLFSFLAIVSLIISLYFAIVKSKFDAAAFFLVEAYVLFPIEYKKRNNEI